MPGDTSSGQEMEPQKPSCLAYTCYYCLLFWSNWFGASHFDFDNDGDFDPEDVEAYINKWSNGSAGKTGQRSPSPASARGTSTQQRTSAGARSARNSSSRVAPSDDGSGVGGQPRPAAVGAAASSHSLGEAVGDVEDMMAADVDGMAQEEMMMENIVKKRRLPLFIMLECAAAGILWLYFAIVELSKEGSSSTIWNVYGGLDSIGGVGSLSLRLTEDCRDLRPEFWRWLTYQFTHVGITHIGMNCLLNILLGIPLEFMHGNWRLAVMYNIGVIGGACAYSVSDAHGTVVGMSGGCYALFGIHYADLVINWTEKKFRRPTLFVLILLFVVDFVNYYFSSTSNSSNSAHFGGAVAGFFIGILVCFNMRQQWWERYLQWVCVIIGFLLVAFCLLRTWFTWAPRNIWESEGFCWTRLVYNPDLGAEWLCVRCSDQVCIDKWSDQEHVQPASLRYCDSVGWLN